MLMLLTEATSDLWEVSRKITLSQHFYIYPNPKPITTRRKLPAKSLSAFYQILLGDEKGP